MIQPHIYVHERRHAAVAFAILTFALVANLASDVGPLRAALLLIAVGMCWQSRVPWRAWWPLLASALAGGLAVAAASSLALPTPRVLDVATRTFVGASYGVWFGNTVSWRALREAARAAKVPVSWLDFMDATMLHVAILGLSLERRRLAAVVRGGWSQPKQQINNTGMLLASVVVAALDRGLRLEEAAAMRAAERQEATGNTNVFSLTSVRVGQPQAPRLSVRELHISTGTWTLLAGASGAGKSTLLRLLAGLQELHEGKLWRFGKPVVGRSVKQRVDGQVALVFQDPEDQFFASEVQSDLAWGLSQRGIVGQAADLRIREVLGWVGLTGLESRAISCLSFGERKRLALASALVIQPEVLLCDEPTMGLDPVSSRLVVEALTKAEQKRPMTVVWATHDLAALPAQVTEAVLLREGRVVFRGTSTEALTRERLAQAGLV